MILVECSQQCGWMANLGAQACPESDLWQGQGSQLSSEKENAVNRYSVVL